MASLCLQECHLGSLMPPARFKDPWMSSLIRKMEVSNRIFGGHSRPFRNRQEAHGVSPSSSHAAKEQQGSTQVEKWSFLVQKTD